MSAEEGLSKVGTKPILNPSPISNLIPIILCFHFPFPRPRACSSFLVFFNTLSRVRTVLQFSKTNTVGTSACPPYAQSKKRTEESQWVALGVCFREVSEQQQSTLVSVLVRCLPYRHVGRFALKTIKRTYQP